MIKWLQDGLKGRSLQATLRLYLFGVIVLAPIVTLIGFLFNAETAFQMTPLLVLILVGVEYGVCYLFKGVPSREFTTGDIKKRKLIAETFKLNGRLKR